MSQAVSYQVPPHPTGVDMRVQLNAIVAAILGDNSGPTEPVDLYPGMMWGDTTGNRLKRRNNANDAWIDLGPLDDFLGDLRTDITALDGRVDTLEGSVGSINNKVNKTGDSMTGDLWINNYACVYLNGGAGHAGLRVDAGIGNGYGGGGLGWGSINNANDAWNFQISDNGNYWFRGFAISDFYRVGNNGDANGYQCRLGPGYLKTVEYNYGPYIDFARTADQDFRWRIHYNFNNDQLEFISRDQYMTFLTDGNIWCSGRGYVWDAINNRAPWAAQCHYNSGMIEGAGCWGGQNTCDFGDPWVMTGLRVTTSTDINRIYPRGYWLRNC